MRSRKIGTLENVQRRSRARTIAYLLIRCTKPELHTAAIDTTPQQGLIRNNIGDNSFFNLSRGRYWPSCWPYRHDVKTVGWRLKKLPFRSEFIIHSMNINLALEKSN